MGVKNLLRFVILTLLGLLAVACAPATAPTPTVAPANDPPAGEAQASGSTVKRGVSEDITLVASTGRPQFLDSYATW
jgi:hypothetical protein